MVKCSLLLRFDCDDEVGLELMDRELKLKDELRQIVQDRIDQRTEVDGDHVIVSIYWHEPDKNGCNWDQKFRGESCLTDTVLAIVAELRSKYNLAKLGVHRD